MCALAAVLVLCACAFGPTETRDDTFGVRAGPQLTVRNDNGETFVRAGEQGSIRVVAEIRNADNVKYEALQAGDTVAVEAEVINPYRSTEVRLTITVPSDTRITMETGNGPISVAGLRSSGNVTTGNGNLELSDLEGAFVVTSGNGSISLSDVDGAFTAVTGNGHMAADKAAGSFALTVGNGNITFGGDLEPGTASSINSGRGSVVVGFSGQPSVRIDAQTDDGRVTTDLVLSETTRSDQDHLIGVLGDGAAELSVRCGSGDITLR